MEYIPLKTNRQKLAFMLFGLLFSLSLVTSPVYSAVTITPNVTLNTTGTNTLYSFPENTTVDFVTITSTLLNITNSSTGDFLMSATPSSGSINISVLEFGASNKEFELSSSNASVSVDFVVGNVTPNSSLQVTKNGSALTKVDSNSSGYITFTYSQGLSSAISIKISAPNPSSLISSLVESIPGSRATVVSQKGKVTKTFNLIRPFFPQKLTEEDLVLSETPVTEIFIDVKRLVRSVSITVEKLEEKPVELPNPSGETFKYFKIDAVNLLDEDVYSAKIKFKVDRNWIGEEVVNKSSINLYRYVNGWVKLTTRSISEDSSFTYFESDTPGFSIFAIAGDAIVEERKVTEIQTPQETNYTGFIVAIVSIVLIIIVAVIFLVNIQRGSSGKSDKVRRQKRRKR